MLSQDEVHEVLNRMNEVAHFLVNHGFTVAANFQETNIDAAIRSLKEIAKKRKDQYLFFWQHCDQLEFERGKSPLYVSCLSAHGYFNEVDEKKVAVIIRGIFSKYGLIYEWRENFLFKIKVNGCMSS